MLSVLAIFKQINLYLIFIWHVKFCKGYFIYTCNIRKNRLYQIQNILREITLVDLVIIKILIFATSCTKQIGSWMLSCQVSQICRAHLGVYFWFSLCSNSVQFPCKHQLLHKSKSCRNFPFQIAFYCQSFCQGLEWTLPNLLKKQKKL